jgi:nicotinamide mononucleotide transporter
LAIASSILYGYVFWNTQLYGQAALQMMFIAMAAWGWRQWLRGQTLTAPSTETNTAQALPISLLRRHERLRLLGVTILVWVLCTWVLEEFSESKVLYWDALITALALLGQYLLGRKKIETWWIWLVVNILTIALMASQDLWLTALLYFVFAVLSVVGLKTWQKQDAH